MKLFVIVLFLEIILLNICYSQSGEDQKESMDAYMEDLKIKFDHLEPVNSYFELPTYKIKYYQYIKSSLLGDLSNEPLSRMLVFPSFEPEFVISIDKKDGLYYLSYIVLVRKESP